MMYWQITIIYILINIASNVAHDGEVPSSLGNEPPIYLSEGVVISTISTCGLNNISNYVYVVFEGFLNLAKLMLFERNKGSLLLIMYKEQHEAILCRLDYQWGGGANLCDSLSVTIDDCSCQLKDLLLRVSFDLHYRHFYMDAKFSLNWFGPERSIAFSHSLSSVERNLPMAYFGSYSTECSHHQRDAMPRYRSVRVHTVADDPPVFLSDSQIFMAPMSTDVKNEDLYHKMVFEGYVNMARVPLEERKTGIVRFLCDKRDGLIQLCQINVANSQIEQRNGTNCTYDSNFLDMKLRVFAQITYAKDIRPCVFTLHWIATHTLSSDSSQFALPKYVGRLKNPVKESEAFQVCTRDICFNVHDSQTTANDMYLHVEWFSFFQDAFNFPRLPDKTTSADGFLQALFQYYDALQIFNKLYEEYRFTESFHRATMTHTSIDFEIAFRRFLTAMTIALDHARREVAVTLKEPVVDTPGVRPPYRLHLNMFYNNARYFANRLDHLLKDWLRTCALCN